MTATYFRDQHLMRVLKAGQAAGLKGVAMAVLSYMCDASKFTRPTVCVSKETIAERTGYCVKSIKVALRLLRERGLLVPVAAFEGGRHRATIYKLTTKGEKGGENAPPLDSDTEKGGSFFPKGGKFFPKRGEESSPPSISLSISSSRRDGSAFRAGGASASLDVAQGGNRDAAKPLSDGERVLVAAMRDDLKTMSYGEARERDKARRASQAERQDLL